MTSVKEYRARLERYKGKYQQLLGTLSDLEERTRDAKVLLSRCEKAREIIKQVGLKTQQQLSYNISEITTMALSTVFDNPYELSLEFLEKRNKTECEIYFTRGKDVKIHPFDGGVGAIDIAAFALRIASWSMMYPRLRNTFILDEPFKHLKGDQPNAKALVMVAEISDKLGIQIIMVSDERVDRRVTLEAADQVLEVSISKGGVSRISLIEV